MIDSTDRKILNIMIENSRLSYRQIAKKANVSVATVMNRVNKLTKHDVIKSYSVTLDYEKLGFDIEAFIEVKISRKKSSPFVVEDIVFKNNNIHGIYDVTGDFDHILVGKFKNRKQLNDFLEKLNSLPAVENSHTRFVLKNFKEANVKL